MPSVNINAANISSVRLAESAAPAAPASGFAQLYIDTNGDLATVKDNSGGITIATSPASSAYTLTVDGTGTAARLNASNVFTGSNRFSNTIAVGGVAPAASGSGVTFPANFAASSDVNTLDDYEEGSFTPVLEGSTGNPSSVTYGNINAGYYTKIGNQVVVQGHLHITAYTGGTGKLVIAGLPFTIASGTYASGSVSLDYLDTPAGVIGSTIFIRSDQSAQKLRITHNFDNATHADADLSTLASATRFIFFNITYRA